MRRRTFLSAGAYTLAALARGETSPPAPERPPVTLPPGDHRVSASLALGSYIGAGAATRLVCAPTLDNLFNGTGTLALKDLALVGNGRGASYRSGFAAYVRDGLIDLDGVSLENFRSSYWVFGQRSRLRARNVTAVSRPGNAINGAAITEQSCLLVVVDGDLDVHESRFDCAYIKGAIALYGASRGSVARSTISEAGTSGEIADNAGAYAILAYAEASGQPTLTVTDCVINGARSCGIHAASAARVEVRGTLFSRVTDRHDDTLPKAAISLNGSPDYLLSGNSFRDCCKNIVLATQTSRRELVPE